MADPIDPGVDIGHIHLKVADLDRAMGFYAGVLGFELTARMGPAAAFLSAGGYHHHIGLNTWESRNGSSPPAGRTGLYRAAIRDPDRAALADALRRLTEARIPLDGASDHGVSEALYLRDPDGNGLELYWDRPRDEWPRAADASIQMTTARLDVDALLEEARHPRPVPAAAGTSPMSPETPGRRPAPAGHRRSLVRMAPAALRAHRPHRRDDGRRGQGDRGGRAGTVRASRSAADSVRDRRGFRAPLF